MTIEEKMIADLDIQRSNQKSDMNEKVREIMTMINACDEAGHAANTQHLKEIHTYISEVRLQHQEELLKLFTTDLLQSSRYNTYMELLHAKVNSVKVLTDTEFISIYSVHLPQFEKDWLATENDPNNLLCENIDVIVKSRTAGASRIYRFRFNILGKTIDTRWKQIDLPWELYSQIYADKLKEEK